MPIKNNRLLVGAIILLGILLVISWIDFGSGDGILIDVTGGSASGFVMASYDGEIYTINADFSGLEDPPPGQFYEGWIVKTFGGAPIDVRSSGKAIKTNGQYTLVYTIMEDLTDHDFFVLTIEQVDDLSPEEHILEGKIKY